MSPIVHAYDWVSDYGQFYLTDRVQTVIAGIETVDDADIARGFKADLTGIAVYTADSLKQSIRIELYGDASTAFSAPMPDVPAGVTMKTADTLISAPSGEIVLFSPTMVTDESGPRFAAPAQRLNVRIIWLEHPAPRDDSASDAPHDVIIVRIWPG